MPVNTLYCEGDIQSIDVQVLLKIVPDGCVVKPIGSKHGFRQRILGARDIQPNMIIAGIKDRDFDDDNSKPMNTPHEWYAALKNQQVPLGWYWERKEIENYLIDPKVVKFALGNKAPPIDKYKTALDKSARKIARPLLESHYLVFRIQIRLLTVGGKNGNWATFFLKSVD